MLFAGSQACGCTRLFRRVLSNITAIPLDGLSARAVLSHGRQFLILVGWDHDLRWQNPRRSSIMAFALALPGHLDGGLHDLEELDGRDQDRAGEG